MTEQTNPPAGVPAIESAVATTGRRREAPERPPVANPNAAPVLVKLTPPFSVRASQFLWIISFTVGGFAVVYFFVIRQTQLPLIADVVRGVSGGRAEQTYETAAEVVFWIVFGVMVAALLTQITLLVSFMSRRPKVRWWQLATLAVQVLLLLMSMELVAIGERGEPLRLLLAAQCGLVLLALLWSVLPNAIAWSARQHDIRRGPQF